MSDEPKPVEDGYPFELVQDSLANAMGLRLPNRALWMIQGPVGSGKSLISQRLIFGLLENGSKLLVVTTELTTRGWVEQMESVGYPITKYLANGKLMVFSRYGVIAESKPDVGIIEVLESEAVDKADVVVIDTASSLMPVQSTPDENLAFMQRLRGICSDSHSILLTIDKDEVDSGMLHSLRSSCEVVLDMNAAFVGGELKRNLVVTRFLRASGPVQASVGWRVEPYMGFIVDITAVS